MTKKLAALIIAMMIAFTLSAALADGVTVTDMYGREIALSEPVTRIVALTPADCEILCALGCEDALVGRGAYCNYPASVLALPAVQSGAETNLEEILALRPQVVLMGDMAQSAQQVAALEENGVRVVLSDANDIAGVYTAIRMIGALMGRGEAAEALVGDMQAAFDGIAAGSEASGKTVYFEVSPLEWGLWTAGSGTFMDELATLCGATNAFADLTGWQAVSEEQVLLRNPDYIISIAGMGEGAVTEIMNREGWSAVTAVQDAQVLNVDADAISRPGPRLVEAALELYRFLNGSPDTAEVPAA